jgi:hypothetical protein
MSIRFTCRLLISRLFRYGVMSKDEVRDVLYCFLFVLKYINDDQLIDWWGHCSPSHLNAFFSILELVYVIITLRNCAKLDMNDF